jgi:hypothetical protein
MTEKQITEALNMNGINIETMQYIIEKVGLRGQMLRQLISTANQEELTELIALMEEYQTLNNIN